MSTETKEYLKINLTNKTARTLYLLLPSRKDGNRFTTKFNVYPNNTYFNAYNDLASYRKELKNIVLFEDDSDLSFVRDLIKEADFELMWALKHLDDYIKNHKEEMEKFLKNQDDFMY